MPVTLLSLNGATVNKKIFLAAAGCAGLVTLAACSGASGGAQGSPTSSGNTLTAAISSEPDSLDPATTTLYGSFEVLANVFDTLVEPDPQDRMGPGLATSWTTSANQLTWTFHLRTTKFQDGTPFTSADVVYTYDRIINQKLAYDTVLATVASVSASGPHVVIIRLKQPTPDLLYDLGDSVGLSIVEPSNVESGAIKNHPVGTGPFSVTSWIHGSSISLTANPHYWGGAPKLAGIKFVFVSDATVALQDLKDGDVQWTDNIPIQETKSLESSSGGSFGVHSVPGTEYWYLNLNERNAPFNNPLVRQAIAYAINRNAIVKAATFGTGVANQTAIPKTSAWYYDYAPYTYDPAKAKALLAQAGVHALTLSIMAPSAFTPAVTTAQLVDSELSAIGVKVSIKLVDTPTFLANETTKAWDIYVGGQTTEITPFDFYYLQDSCHGAHNWQEYCNPQVDKLMDQANRVPGTAAQKALYDQAVKIIVDQASYIYLYNQDNVEGWSDSLHGYQIRTDSEVSFRNASLSG